MSKRIDTERRDYFRIDDRVVLHYREVASSVVDSQPAEQHFPVSSTFDLIRELRALEMDHSLSRNLAEYDRELEQQLRLLHKKIDRVASAVVALDQSRSGIEPQPVSLSEGGIAFNTPHPMPAGTTLALQIQLLPDLVGLCVYGEVIHNQHESGADSRQTAVQFLNLREAERQLLAKHILKAQIEARRRRQQGE